MSSENPEDRARAIYERAKSLPESERPTYLDDQCADSAELRDTVEQMLHAGDNREGGFSTNVKRWIREVAADVQVERLTVPQRDEQLPELRRATAIGEYYLLERVGEGGMGEVWKAEQRGAVRREVALKVIKWGMDTKQVLARFESERQALALMNHPNIASAYDAGATKEGRPYFAMEYVHGVPITDFCDSHRLTVEERLRLFVSVCEAVQHAHHKGIIHRDIKPPNVLVALQENEPVPKIIDFGVAKAISQRLTEHTIATELGQLIGTREYMSPEQAEMTNLDIDTRTDVYSLGVLLYELLVGARPFDPKELQDAGLAELQRKLREDEPPRPSVRISGLGRASTTSASNRNVTVKALVRQLHGDLDWITMKAMEKDRRRRYETANALGLDVTRYLDNEPVRARPPSATYRLRKYVQRHRVGAAATILVVLAMLGGLAAASFGLVRARRAERAAQREAEVANQVSQFLSDLFEVSDPGEARGNAVTAREILDRGAEKIDEELSEQPLVRARLMNTMGDVYRKLGLYDRAETLVREALAVRERELGEDHLDVATSLDSLARTLTRAGEFSDARPLFERAISIQERHVPRDDLALARTTEQFSMTLMLNGYYDEALPLMERALAIRQQRFEPGHPEIADALHRLGSLYAATGRYPEAQASLERALAIREKSLGPDHPDLARTLNNLAYVVTNTGDHLAGLRLYERTLPILENALGPHHYNVAVVLNNIGHELQALERYDEALGYYGRAVDVFERSVGSDHPELARTLVNLGRIHYSHTREYERAKALIERALEIRQSALGQDHPDTIWAVLDLAWVYSRQEQHLEAEKLFREALGNQQRVLGDDHPNGAWYWAGLAHSHRVLDRPDEAERHFERALEMIDALDVPNEDLLRRSLVSEYGEFLREAGRDDEADAMEARFDMTGAR